ncbi:MAG TPA: hypothetical protein VF773_09875 [Verrucomicrobiae bacterium]
MNAAEIIEHFNRLPVEDKQVVREYLGTRRSFDSSVDDAAVRLAEDEIFSKYDNLLKHLHPPVAEVDKNELEQKTAEELFRKHERLFPKVGDRKVEGGESI